MACRFSSTLSHRSLSATRKRSPASGPKGRLATCPYERHVAGFAWGPAHCRADLDVQVEATRHVPIERQAGVDTFERKARRNANGVPTRIGHGNGAAFVVRTCDHFRRLLVVGAFRSAQRMAQDDE